MNCNVGMNVGQIIGMIKGYQVIGLDIVKNVFQLYIVDMGSGEIINMQFKCVKVLVYFVNKVLCLIGIEVCGGVYYWVCWFEVQGYQVWLIYVKVVWFFVFGNKIDVIDV